MSIKDQYLNLCEARVEALEKEIQLYKKFIARDYARRDIDAQTTEDLFKAFKADETKI